MPEPEGYPFTFAGEVFIARPSGALWWPARAMLVVADLHLGRSERYARRGGALLPPYEVSDTLDRLAAEITALEPQTVVSLGDSFDDVAAAAALSSPDAARLADLAQQSEWYWVQGNHDPSPVNTGIHGQSLPEITDRPSLRHEAGAAPDISGHLHPSTRLAGKSWRCFVVGQDHLILPAFGTYTGGLDIADPAIADLAQGGIAIVCAPRPFARPLPPRKKGMAKGE